jgi:3,4-dihydroxy 2-butanone 4-phosphate synthase/GTP cyclohydrolase II
MFNTIEEAIEDVRMGKVVIIADDEDRENEGDLCCAAEKATPETINFMTKYGRGIICLSLTKERVEGLKLDLIDHLNSQSDTAFTVSIDANRRFGVTTGTSAHDRARTIKVAIDPEAKPEDLCRPGHVFPLRARPGGVLRRVGQTEASVDLARLAGLYPAGVICEVLDHDGTMARRPQLETLAKQFDLKLITVADLIKYRLRTERFMTRMAEANLPTRFGDFRVVGYENQLDGTQHVALVKGDIRGEKAVLVRMHSECLTGDVLGSLKCDCGGQLYKALSMIEEEGRGVLVYLRQEGRGIGLLNKIKAYSLQDSGADTVDANIQLGLPPDKRDYGQGAQILLDLGVRRIRLLTNNPQKLVGLKGYGLEIVERLPLQVSANEYNHDYLLTKVKKMGHLISLE